MFLDYYLEVYYGENDNIRQMQQCITNFRKDIFQGRGTRKYSTNSQILKLSRLIEKEFGFKTFSICIATAGKPNGGTLILSHDYKAFSKNNNPYSNLIVTKNGYKFKPEAEYVSLCIMHIAFFENNRFTDREILAILLHEIGHNFQVAISQKQDILNQTAMVAELVERIYLWILDPEEEKLISNLLTVGITWTGITQRLVTAFHEFCLAVPELYDLISNVTKSFSDIFFPLRKIKDYISHIFKFKKIPKDLIVKLNPLALAISYFKSDYRGEKLADSFATIYGYGPELSSALEKLDTTDIQLDLNVPIISPLLGMIECTYSFLVNIPNDHPATVNRINDQIKYLKKELSKEDLDPKMKKEIELQIRDIEATLRRITALHYKGALSDFHYMDHVYQAILYYIFGGDPRDLIYTKLPKDDLHADIERTRQNKLMEEKSLVCKMLNNVKLI